MHTRGLISPYATAGKSVTVHAAARHWHQQVCNTGGSSAGAHRLISINCMSLAQPREVFSRILEGTQTPPPRSSSAPNMPGHISGSDPAGASDNQRLAGQIAPGAGRNSGEMFPHLQIHATTMLH